MAGQSADKAAAMSTRDGPIAQAATSPPVARLREVSLRYGKTFALDAIDIDVPAGCMVGVIGSDGVGKSSLFSLIAGSRAIQTGQIEVLGGSMADKRHRHEVCPRIAYMPQGLGKNLYPDYPFRQACPGHPVPRCGTFGCLAAVHRPCANRLRSLCRVACTLPQNHRPDGMRELPK